METKIQISTLRALDENGSTPFRNSLPLHALEKYLPCVNKLFSKNESFITYNNTLMFDLVVQSQLPPTQMLSILRLVFMNYLAQNNIPNPQDVMIVSVGDRPMPQHHYAFEVSHKHTSPLDFSETVEKVYVADEIRNFFARTLYLAETIFTNVEYYKTAIGVLFRYHAANAKAREQLLDLMGKIGLPELVRQYSSTDTAFNIETDLDLLFGLGRYHQSILMDLVHSVNRMQ